MLRCCSLALLLCLSLLPTEVMASASEEAQTLFQQGVRAYESERYEDSLKLWEKLVREHGGSYTLYFNLGGAAFRMEDYPRAIWYFEQALAFRPGDTDAQDNLRLAYLQQFGEEPPDLATMGPVSRFMNAAYQSISLNAFTIASLVLYIGLFAVLTVTALPRAKLERSTGVTISLVLGLLFLPMCAGMIVKAQDNGRAESGVVLSQNAVLYAEPRGGSEQTFTMKGGVKVLVEEQRGQYYLVSSPEFGARGWMLDEHLGLL